MAHSGSAQHYMAQQHLRWKCVDSLDCGCVCQDSMEHLACKLMFKFAMQALQDAVDQSLATGFHDGIDKILHMACHNLHEYGAPQIVYATRFAAQLVLHKLGEAARQRRLSYLHSAAGHAHSQVARGYWFEKTAHQALSNGGKFPFRLLGKL